MSLSFWLILTAVIGICVFVFTKTVSSDAKNDYKIRDILANTKSELRKEEQEEPEEEPVPVATVPKQSFEEYQNEHNVYEELVAKQREKGYQSYSTMAHEEKEEEEPSYTEEKVYYEKINDDACPEGDDYEEDYEEPKVYYDKDNYQEKALDEDEKTYTTKKKPFKSLFDYVKTFWRGITFTVGLLVCLYAFGGLAYNVQTSNDAIVYSIWLLIGVILIK